MLKYLFVVLFLFFFLSTSAVSIYAQAPRHYYDWSSTLETRQQKVLGAQKSSQETSAFNKYLFGKDLLPNNPFYFTKKWQENIQVFSTSDKKTRVELQIAIASTRLEEMQALSDSQNQKFIPSVASSYRKTITNAISDIQQLKKSNSNIDQLLASIEKEPTSHNIALQELALIVPDDTKNSLNQALEVANKNSDLLAELQGKPVLPADLAERIVALQAQGILTPEEAKKITESKTRAAARARLSKYIAEGIFPEADFLRLNGDIKTLYPEEFYKLYETKKILELKALESEKPDQATLVRLQTFAKTYKPGDPIPEDIRKHWIPVIRLEEIQNTVRPDLIDTQLLKNDREAYQKLQEIAERVKPKSEDITKVNNYLKKNNLDPKLLPPDYLRIYNLTQKYGAQCSINEQWVKTSEIEGKCVQNAGSEKPKTKITTLSCPANTRAIVVSYMPEGGYCVPDYAPINTILKSETSQNIDYYCPVGYFRENPSGPCVQGYKREDSETLTPITQTPGTYPNPVYPPTSSSTTSPASSSTTTPFPTVSPLATPTPTPTSVISTPTPTSPPAQKPDVSMSGIQRSDAASYGPAVGEQISFRMFIGNSNIYPVYPPNGFKVKVKAWYDNSEVYSTDVELSSTPNKGTSVNSNSISITSGTHKFKGCVDTDNQLDESREENNCLEWNFESLSAPPASPSCPPNTATNTDLACALINCPTGGKYFCSTRTVPNTSPVCIEATGCSELPDELP